MRKMGFYLFASVKGGVGKSTLAVLATKLLAERGRHPVLLDSDVLGSSLADGLGICAPVIAHGDTGPDYRAPPTGQWHSLVETRQLRDARRLSLEERGNSENAALSPPFLNDALLFEAASVQTDCRVDAMLWRHSPRGNDRYFPSSPVRFDGMRIAPYITGNDLHFSWVRRTAWIIDALISNNREITDVIVDLPPGTWALSHEALVLAGKIEQPLPSGYPQWQDEIAWTAVPTIVTTPDRNDRLLAMEYWNFAREKIKGLGVLMNRTRGSTVALKKAIHDDLPRPLQQLGIENTVRFAPNLSRSLGQLFVDGALQIDESLRELSPPLRLDFGEDP